MEPEAFGPFLKEARKQCELTQAQLAERLHVSTAAVSKWERGKCLPDIAKIEEIADALQLSVLEVMKCEIRQEPLPRQELTQVYEETLKTASQQSNREIRRGILIAVCVAALCLTFHYFPVYHIVQVWAPSCFDTGEVSKLAYIGSREDRRTAQLILAQAEEAFSDLSLTREEAKEKYGLLSRYVTPSDRGVVEESHSLKLWSAHFEGTIGYMWVWYTQEGKDADGKAVTGSWNIPALWRLNQMPNGEWKIVGIKEHP